MSAAKFPGKSAKHVWLVKFYSPGCTHCRQAAPKIEALAQKLEGAVKVGIVNCDVESGLCAEHNVRSFPTLKLVVEGRVEEYEGPVEPTRVLDFISEKLPGAVVNVRRVAAATDFLSQAAAAKKPAALLFTDKYETPLAFKALSQQMKDKAMLGEVRASNAVVSDRFAVGKYPTLLVFCAGDQDQVVEYQGDLKFKEISAFVAGLTDSAKCAAAAKHTKRSPPRKKPVIDLGSLDLKTMRVSEMRRILEEQGEECLGCAEKADFVKKIEEVAKRQKRKA